MASRCAVWLPLGLEPGSEVLAVNSAGAVVISRYIDGRESLWRLVDDHLSPLDLDGEPRGGVLALAEDGTAAGYVQSDESASQAAVWPYDEAVRLGDRSERGAAFGVAGPYVVGFDDAGPCVWFEGHAFHPWGAEGTGVASGVNRHGVVAGSIGHGGHERATCASPQGTATWSCRLGRERSWLNAVNDQGLAVGCVGRFPGACQAVWTDLSRAGERLRLRALGVPGNALRINNAGTIVGCPEALDDPSWCLEAGHLTVLQCRVDVLPGTLPFHASDLAGSGWISGSVVTPQGHIAAVLVPGLQDGDGETV